MKMKLLVVDYCTIWGHRNFNKIHVESLYNIGYELHLVGRKESLSFIEQKQGVTKTFIPPQLDSRNNHNVIIKNAKDILFLLWLKGHFNFNGYDAIVFLAYDVKSLFFFRIRHNVFLVNHNNIANLDSKINLFLTRHLPRKYGHIALSTDAMDYFKTVVPGKNVIYVPHGFLRDYPEGISPSFIKEGDRFLFCPINILYDDKLLYDIFSSEKVKVYLKDKRLVVIIKRRVFNDTSSVFKCIEGRFNDDEYCYLIKHAEAVLLPYQVNYKYRSSGILFESIAARTPIFATEIDSLRIYKNQINISFFSDANSFIDCVENLQSAKNKTYNYSLFCPDAYWKSIINDSCNM